MASRSGEGDVVFKLDLKTEFSCIASLGLESLIFRSLASTIEAFAV
jgi:hypothetical protein